MDEECLIPWQQQTFVPVIGDCLVFECGMTLGVVPSESGVKLLSRRFSDHRNSIQESNKPEAYAA
ncbi:MAG: hypothetical protein JWM11_3327 [Planctomycetaceae bacterium]|nr:hypothetical protein [Planctomycetaceae bacterium]